MCTCLFLKTKPNLFGRNMDIEFDLNESIIIVPRNYKIKYKKERENDKHFAFIGMGTIIDNYFATVWGKLLSNKNIGFIYEHNRGHSIANDIVMKDGSFKR